MPEFDIINRNARIGVGVGATISIGDYQSVKPYVYLEIDSLEAEDYDLDTLYDNVKAYLICKLDELAEDLKEIMC